MSMGIQIIPIRSNGNLCYLESERDFPFPIKRVYFTHGEKIGAHRGFHAHKTLKQVLFCPHGRINIILDDGNERAEVMLDCPAKGLFLENSLIWREIIWLKDKSVLCVLASDYYDESDYIRDYDEFLAYLSDGRA